MTHFLASDEKPDGYKLEEILQIVRRDILKRCLKIADDPRPEALHVMANNMRILDQITTCIQIAEDSTHVLNKAFGPSLRAEGGPPRIGVK